MHIGKLHKLYLALTIVLISLNLITDKGKNLRFMTNMKDEFIIVNPMFSVDYIALCFMLL